jgi:hypothetical protein
MTVQFHTGTQLSYISGEEGGGKDNFLVEEVGVDGWLRYQVTCNNVG